MVEAVVEVDVGVLAEKFLLLLYNAPKTCHSLDDLRFINYKKTSEQKETNFCKWP